jgi:PleD family two-component response regulator
MESSMQAIERAQRNAWDIWLVTVDIDFFKRVNDTYGHAAGDVIAITISIGVARKKTDESLEQLVHRADKALYRAKEDGRNCVVEAYS